MTQGAARIFIEVEGPAADVLAAVQAVPGVLEARIATENGVRNRFQVDGEGGRDVRTDLARAVVNKGWVLLELQSESMSLEDIFIKLTTAEEITPPTAS